MSVKRKRKIFFEIRSRDQGVGVMQYLDNIGFKPLNDRAKVIIINRIKRGLLPSDPFYIVAYLTDKYYESIQYINFHTSLIIDKTFSWAELSRHFEK